MTLDGTLEAIASPDEVRFVLTVRNDGTDQVALTFPDAGRADVSAIADGREVWRYAAERAFAQAIEERRLDPGEAETYEVRWSDPVPGEYVAVARLRAREHHCEARTEFEV